MSLPWQDIAWRDLAIPQLRGLKLGLWLDAGWGTAADARGARGRARPQRARSSRPVPSSNWCRRSRRATMADGMDHFWRMRSWLDISALPVERQARVLPFIRQWVARGETLQCRASLPRLQPDGRAARRRGQRHEALRLRAVAGQPGGRPSRPNGRCRRTTREHPFEHIAFTLPFNMSEQPALSGSMPATAQAACRSACRSSATATTTSACCAWHVRGSNCAVRSGRGQTCASLRPRRAAPKRPEIPLGGRERSELGAVMTSATVGAMTQQQDARGLPVGSGVGQRAGGRRCRVVANDVVLRHAAWPTSMRPLPPTPAGPCRTR